MFTISQLRTISSALNTEICEFEGLHEMDNQYKLMKKVDEMIESEYPLQDNKLLELLEWLKGEKYITVDEHSTTMTEEFEREHKYELSRNIMINKTIKKIEELIKRD